MQRGSSDADIAKLLSDQRGFDRTSAIDKGNTDEQTIKYLMADTTKSIIDDNKSLQHKTEGDKYYGESLYDKAAKEYTLAIKCSDDKYEPYKLRADTYKQYLITKLDPVSGSDLDKTRQGLIDKSRALMCSAIYTDYTKAIKINDKALSNNLLELDVLKKRMTDDRTDYDTNINVAPYYYKSAQRTHDMRRLRQLNRSRGTLNSADASIKKDLSDYKLVCGKENAAHGE
jgi:tetratricopeptide (TPR) repeat protein